MIIRSRGATDNASDYGSEDWRFESSRDRNLLPNICSFLFIEISCFHLKRQPCNFSRLITMDLTKGNSDLKASYSLNRGSHVRGQKFILPHLLLCFEDPIEHVCEAAYDCAKVRLLFIDREFCFRGPGPHS